METAAPAAWLRQVIDCNNVAVRLIRQERVVRPPRRHLSYGQGGIWRWSKESNMESKRWPKEKVSGETTAWSSQN